MRATSRKPNNPTVTDVAREAKVSTATVSRALSNPDTVSAKTRARITEAVQKTGYVINHAARNLRRRQTGTIVALVPDIGNSHFSNVLQGIENVTAAKGLKVLIADTRKPSMSQPNFTEYFSRANCDGIISLDGQYSIANVRAVNPELPPIVTAGEWSDDPNVPIAVIDNLLGADLAVSHLLALGHQNIGIITGLLTHKPGLDRLEGYQMTMQKGGIDTSTLWSFPGDYSFECGVAAAKDLLTLSTRPTAVFCSSDRTAFGFISTLSASGVRVPDDISVVGFDDLDIAEHYIPSLTTIHQPRRKVGEMAAKLLLSLIAGDQPEVTHEQIEPWLVVRNSTKAAK